VTQIEILEAIFSGLDHGDALRSQHNEQFVYLKKRCGRSSRSKGSLTPADFKKVLEENKKAIAFIEAYSCNRSLASGYRKKMVGRLALRRQKSERSSPQYYPERSGHLPRIFPSLCCERLRIWKNLGHRP